MRLCKQSCLLSQFIYLISIRHWSCEGTEDRSWQRVFLQEKAACFDDERARIHACNCVDLPALPLADMASLWGFPRLPNTQWGSYMLVLKCLLHLHYSALENGISNCCEYCATKNFIRANKQNTVARVRPVFLVKTDVTVCHFVRFTFCFQCWSLWNQMFNNLGSKIFGVFAEFVSSSYSYVETKI